MDKKERLEQLRNLAVYLTSIGITRMHVDVNRPGMVTLTRGDNGVNEVFDTHEYPGGWSTNFEAGVNKLGYVLELKSDNYLNIVPEGV